MKRDREKCHAVDFNRKSHAFETGFVRDYLREFRREDLVSSLFVSGAAGEEWATLNSLWKHVWPSAPMKFQAWFRAPPPPKQSFGSLLTEIWTMRSDLDLAKWFSGDQTIDHWVNQGLGLLLVHDGMEVIVHNRPEWSPEKPIAWVRFEAGVEVAMHHSRRFLSGLATKYNSQPKANWTKFVEQHKSYWNCGVEWDAGVEEPQSDQTW
jgi:hypothetical protein